MKEKVRFCVPELRLSVCRRRWAPRQPGPGCRSASCTVWPSASMATRGSH